VRSSRFLSCTQCPHFPSNPIESKSLGRYCFLLSFGLFSFTLDLLLSFLLSRGFPSFLSLGLGLGTCRTRFPLWDKWVGEKKKHFIKKNYSRWNGRAERSFSHPGNFSGLRCYPGGNRGGLCPLPSPCTPNHDTIAVFFRPLFCPSKSWQKTKRRFRCCYSCDQCYGW